MTARSSTAGGGFGVAESSLLGGAGAVVDEATGAGVAVDPGDGAARRVVSTTLVAGGRGDSR